MDELVADPVARTRTRFAKEAGTVITDTWIEAGGGVPAHVHPLTSERFEVVEGHVEFLAGRRWIEAGPGKAVDVPPGTRHAFRNRSDDVARFTCHATPGMGLQEFLEDAAALSRAGKLGRFSAPTSFDALLQAAVLAEEHREMVTLGFPLPPRPVQRLVLPPLARLGRRRGHAPGRLGDRA